MAIRRMDSNIDHHTTREFVLSLTSLDKKGEEKEEEEGEKMVREGKKE